MFERYLKLFEEEYPNGRSYARQVSKTVVTLEDGRLVVRREYGNFGMKERRVLCRRGGKTVVTYTSGDVLTSVGTGPDAIKWFDERFAEILPETIADV